MDNHICSEQCSPIGNSESAFGLFTNGLVTTDLVNKFAKFQEINEKIVDNENFVQLLIRLYIETNH